MQRIRLYIIELILIGLLAVAVGFFGYLGYGLLLPDDNPNFSGDQALAHVNSQLKFGPRITGSDRSERMTDWLVENLSGQGWDVVIQPFVVPIGGTASLLNIEGNFFPVPEGTPDDPVLPTESQVLARNIIAIQGPSDAEDTEPAQQGPAILLLTAYDSRHWDDVLPSETRQSVLGANSGASGVAVLLELARSLYVDDTGHTICLAFLDNEANVGLDGWRIASESRRGSEYLVEHLAKDVSSCADPQAVIAVDTVGNADQQLLLDENSTAPLSNSIWQVAAELGYSKWIIDRSEAQPPYIHTPFQDTGSPVTLLMDTGYRYRYTSSDTFDKISAQSLGRVGRTLEVWLERGAVWQEEE